MAIAYGLLEPIELTLPHLPRALEGLRIAHISDLHVRRDGPWYSRLETQLTSQRFDLIVLTGDYIDRTNGEQEIHAHSVLLRLTQRLRPRLGTFGVFGNHDTALLRDQCHDVPIHWLNNENHHVSGRPLEVLGVETLRYDLPDSVALVLNRTPPPAPREKEDDDEANSALAPDERPLRVMLAHEPGVLPTAADLGVDLLLCGHTHGGQCRLPTGHPVINACDLPLSLTSGVLRCRDTLAGVSRGIGWTGWVPRLFCRPHVPVYTLRRGSLPGVHSEHIKNLHPW
ncbi:MAG: metallophosphoesterase [Phycisphaeraceae bacterium]